MGIISYLDINTNQTYQPFELIFQTFYDIIKRIQTDNFAVFFLFSRHTREFFQRILIMIMKTSAKGLAWLKRLEGTVKQNTLHVIYDDQTGQPVPAHTPLPRGATIGYGHLIKRGEDFRHGITEHTATDLLRADITIAEHAIQSCIHIPLTQHQFDALVALAFNIGTNNFKKSTVIKYINDSNFHSTTYPNLESAWLAWNRTSGKKSTGLIRRRQSEFNTYINGTY